MPQTPDTTIKESQFTPGPWTLADGIDGVWRIESKQDKWQICETACCCGANNLPGEDESDANARLIAAAPALYEALKATSCRYSRTRECVGPEMCDRCAALALVDVPATEEEEVDAES